MNQEKKPGLLELLAEWEAQGASDAEITVWMNRYLDGKAREQGVPLHGTFELTPLCNLNCKMCYVHLSEDQLRESGKQLLTVEQWKDIMQQAIDAGMISAILTGGECLTYQGFDELYLFLQEQGIEITVKSNGLLLTEDRIRFFKDHRPVGIQVTLYGADEEAYENVTGIRAFSLVDSGIRRLIEAGISTEISITPSKFMIQNAQELLRVASSYDVPYYINAALFEPREGTGRSGQSNDVSLDDYITLYKLQAKLKNRTLQPLCQEEIPIPSTDGKPTKGVRCAAGRSYFSVRWNGELHPCLSMERIQVDLTKMPFLQAWQIIHSAVLEYPYPCECSSCTYDGMCPCCVVQHEYGGKLGHANPFFCSRVQKLMAEGLLSSRSENC